MLLDPRTALYLHRATTALITGTVAIESTTDVCPECSESVAAARLISDAEHHIAYLDPQHRRVVLLIGCEGYWLIDPNTLGLPSPNWQPNEPDERETQLNYGQLSPGQVRLALETLGEIHAGEPDLRASQIRLADQVTAIWRANRDL
jgi:hypothetical protein